MDLKAIVDKRRKSSIDIDVGPSKNMKKSNSSKIKAEELTDSKRLDSDNRSAAALQGAYHNLSKEASKGEGSRRVSGSVAVETTQRDPLQDILEQAMNERQRATNIRSIFNEMDEDGNGKVTSDEFIRKYYLVDSSLSRDQVYKIFLEAGE